VAGGTENGAVNRDCQHVTGKKLECRMNTLPLPEVKLLDVCCSIRWAVSKNVISPQVCLKGFLQFDHNSHQKGEISFISVTCLIDPGKTVQDRLYLEKCAITRAFPFENSFGHQEINAQLC
jgi:hypothetical protein